MNTTTLQQRPSRFRLSCLSISAIFLLYAPLALASGLVELDEQHLREAAGQALINTSYTAPGQANNPNPNIGIYRLGIEADLELNANIRKLALGCGGVNGAGCDIDIRPLAKIIF